MIRIQTESKNIKKISNDYTKKFIVILSQGPFLQEISKLVTLAGGIWGGAAGGAAGYTLTFAIAYLRDFGLDYRILSESLETMVPWSLSFTEICILVRQSSRNQSMQLVWRAM